MSAIAFAGASAGLGVLTGLFGYFAAEDAAEISESRGRLLRAEADADAEIYADQARGFKASQKLAFLKSGVTLEGSPLDILAETARVAQENVNAIRSRGEAQQVSANADAESSRAQGRAALIGSIVGGGMSVASAAYKSGVNSQYAGAPGKEVAGASRTGMGTPRGPNPRR